MSSVQKVSVSLDAKELRWVKALSKRTKSSVSSLMNEAVRRFREEREREAAQKALLAEYMPEERATPAEIEEFRKEWHQG